MGDTLYPWQEPVLLALMEFEPQQLEAKINAALHAVEARRAELRERDAHLSLLGIPVPHEVSRPYHIRHNKARFRSLRKGSDRALPNFFAARPFENLYLNWRSYLLTFFSRC